jgi:hypothetical protein
MNSHSLRALREPIYYWARTVTPADDDVPHLADAYLNGAFIVDPPGPVPPDRIFVINVMFAPSDVTHKGFEVVTIKRKVLPLHRAARIHRRRHGALACPQSVRLRTPHASPWRHLSTANPQ